MKTWTHTQDSCPEFLVTLRGYSYFTSHLYYLCVKAPSETVAAGYEYSNEDDGELEVVDVRLINDELIMNFHNQLEDIKNRQLRLPLLDIRRDKLEREAYELRQQLGAALDSEIAWA